MRRGFFTARAWRWFVAAPFAAGLLIYGLSHGAPPPAKPALSPWSLTPMDAK